MEPENSDSFSTCFDDVAEEFLEQLRAGKSPQIADFIAKYPLLKTQIDELFPTLLMMEDVGQGSAANQLGNPLYACDAQMLAGTQLGDYRLIREIGRGGMGVVFEAHQQSLGRRVALKVMSESLLRNSSRVTRFERKSRAAACLHHSNIVPVFGVGEVDGKHFYTMQYIDGCGLDAVIAEIRELTEHSGFREKYTQIFSKLELDSQSLNANFGDDENVATSQISRTFLDSKITDRTTYFQRVAAIGVQAAEALHYAHSRGILHRDIKPANLLLDKLGNVWITDFGLAKLDDEHELTGTGEVLGSLRYLAPEALKNESDPRSEVYSLGLTLYELLTLEPALQHVDRGSLVRQVMESGTTPIEKINVRVPKDLRIVIHKAISPRAEDRYPTAAAFAADLDRFVNDLPVQAKEPSSFEQLQRWRRQNRALSSVLLSLAITIMFVALSSVAAATFLFGLNRELDATVSQLDIERDNSEQELYFARIAVAHNRLLMRDVIGAGLPLHQVMPQQGAKDRRGWEWYFLNRWHDGGGQRLEPIGSPDDAVVFSPDGSIIASTFFRETKLEIAAGINNDIALHDTASGKIAKVLASKDHSFQVLAFSADGRFLAGGDSESQIAIWDVASAELVGVIPSQESMTNTEFRRLNFSPDDTRILGEFVHERGRLRTHDAVVYNVSSLSIERETPYLAAAIVISNDGSKIAFLGDEEITLVELSSKALLGSFPLERRAKSFSISDDAGFFAVNDFVGNTFAFDAELAEPISTRHSPFVSNSVALSPNGKWMVTRGTRGGLRKYATNVDPQKLSVRYPARHITSLAFANDENLVKLILRGKVIAMELQQPGEFWATTVVEGVPKDWPIFDGIFWNDGNRVYLVYGEQGGRLNAFDQTTFGLVQEFTSHKGRICHIALSSDGRRIAALARNASTTEVRVHETTTGSLIQTWETPHWARGMALSSDGLRLAIADGTEELTIFDVDSGDVISSWDLEDVSHYLSFSPDDRFLVTVNRFYDDVEVWDVKEEKQVGEPVVIPYAFGVAWSPTEDRVAVSGRDTVHVLEGSTARQILVLNKSLPLAGNLGYTPCVTYSKDGKKIAANNVNGWIDIWNAGGE